MARHNLSNRYEGMDIRIVSFVILFFILYGAVGFRLYDLQINKKYLSQLEVSRGKRVTRRTAVPQRGTIFDANGNILAITRKVRSMYCVPCLVKDKEGTAKELSGITGTDSGFLLSRLNKKSSFAWLKRKLDDDEARYIEEKKIPGIGFREEYQRFYPKGQVFSHVLGYVNIDNTGLEGVEKIMEASLKGQEGSTLCEVDAQGHEILTYTVNEKDAVPGDNVTLTLDEVIQQIVDEELDKLMQKHQPLGAVAIVMEARTGRILAMCSKPSFDPMKPGDYLPEERRNRCITDMFEPGSVFKVITTSAAMNEGIVELDDVFFCENGAYRIANHTLNDTHPYGDLTVREIIAKSSNIGASKIADMMDNSVFHKYMTDFGLGRPTGIPLPGEADGYVKEPRLWSRLSKPSMAMGHEVQVTPLQLASAINVIASGGFYVQPRIIERIESFQGEAVYTPGEPVRREVISPATVEMITEAMKDVVSEHGTARVAALEKYAVAGKTGTAQKLNEYGGYSHSKFVGSFAGFVPADDPVITIVVMADEPRKGGYYGGVVSAPAFAAIADKVMKYLNLKQNGIYVKARLPREEGISDGEPEKAAGRVTL
jgi:cell division protein FtsI (penicillin-binding protein 3)